MSRLTMFLVAVLVACGSKPPPPPTAPLPDDKPVAKAPEPAPAPAPAPVEPAPLPPVELTIEPVTVTVKLVSAGRGKRAPLRYASPTGSKQTVELALDFTFSQKGPAELGGDQVTRVPTIVLGGDAETTQLGDDGSAAYVVSVRSTDARAVAGAGVPVDTLKAALAGMKGLTIGGTVSANGAPTGNVVIRVEQPEATSSQILDMVRHTMPRWPFLPAQPVGVGARWQTTTSTKLVDQIPVTHVTDYELVAHKGTTWTIKAKTKVKGVDQELKGSQISAIQGTGTLEATLTDGALYPTMTSSLETSFTATEAGKALTMALAIGGAVTVKP